MSEITLPYVRQYGDEAPFYFAEDLMRGDPATFKQGYTLENAVIATAEAFGLDENEQKDLREHLDRD